MTTRLAGDNYKIVHKKHRLWLNTRQVSDIVLHLVLLILCDHSEAALVVSV